jgi:hypothetical protein
MGRFDAGPKKFKSVNPGMTNGAFLGSNSLKLHKKNSLIKTV